MERQLQHMVRLIDDLLDVSRISRGKIELRRERVDFAVPIRSAVETSRPLIEEAGHLLTVSLPSEPVFVDADITRLSQVFANLLNNAAKYTPRPGTIELTVERQGGSVLATVKDNGIGILPDQIPSVFEAQREAWESGSRS
jgi:signal transduction histidine kinase